MSYWTFLLFNVVLVFAISGSLFKFLYVIPQASPGEIVDDLATSLASQGDFFTTFIITRISLGLMLNLLQPVPLILYFLQTKILHRKPEAKYTEYVFSVDATNHLLTFTIGIIFSTMSPIILPFTCIYFFIAWMVTPKTN